MASITFTATGDSIITRRVSVESDRRFQALASLIRGVDGAFTNLEVMTPKAPWIPASEYGGGYIASRPFILDELKWLGFNLYNVANNHATDYTFQGLVDTLEELEKRDMRFAGGGRTLGEARSPTYLDTSAGRIALLGVASSYVVGALAADARSDAPGRPGVNPLRHDKEYVVDADMLRAIKRIDAAMGTQAATQRRRDFGLLHKQKPEAYSFLGNQFFEGEPTRMRTIPHERDLEETSRWVRDARRQADLVVVSLHAHEGQAGASNSPEPADFLIDAARAWIDSGADIVVGHGPHMLRALEIYRGKPIFYSLGNFIFMFETVLRQPAEMYENHDLPSTATPADVEDDWSHYADGRPKGFHADPAFWESVLPVCRFEDGRLVQLDLHPLDLSLDEPRTRRGMPKLARRGDGERILTRLRELSEPFGTKIRSSKDEPLVGSVEL